MTPSKGVLEISLKGELKMGAKTFGLYLNKDARGCYRNPDAPEKLIRYITRTNGQDRKDLISWGGVGVLDRCGVEFVISQFYFAQKAHTRHDDFGRYMSHTLFSLSTEGAKTILEKNIDFDYIARQMARDIFERDHCQVVYGVHLPDKSDPHIHIHFAINTVNYRTGCKRHENMAETRERNRRFNQIISDEISERNA